mgnify:FL=1
MNYKINKGLIFLSFLILLFVLPSISFGQNANPNQNQGLGITAPSGQILNISSIATRVLNIAWIITVTATILFFIMAGFKFLSAKGDAHELESAKRFLTWGLLGVLVIMLSFSIITILKNSFGIT